MENKIYATLNGQNEVIQFFSDVFTQPKESDFFVEAGSEEYHAHVHLKYQTYDEFGRLNWCVKDGKLKEIVDKGVLPTPPPSDKERIEVLEEALLEVILGG